MRRTASWGSRDAFSDGHISSKADHQEMPSGRRTRTATTKAHRSKRHHARAPQQRASFSDPDADPTLWPARAQEAHGEFAARRRSAPEAPANRRSQQDPSSLGAATSDDSIVSDFASGEPPSHVRAAVAEEDPSNASTTGMDSLHSGIKHWRTQADSTLGSGNSNSQHRAADVTRAHSPPSKLQPDLQRDGHASLSYANIQRNLLMPYEAASDPRHPPAHPPAGRPSLMALPEEAPAVYAVPSQGLKALSRTRNSSPGTKAPAAVGSASAGMNVRPSMEARRRRLGSSALQVAD